MKLFLDDERFPADNSFLICRNMEDFRICVTNCEDTLDFISFDHDLGSGPSGYDCAKWMVEYDMEHDILSNDFDFYVHSQNPVGAENIRSYLNNYLDNKRKEK